MYSREQNILLAESTANNNHRVLAAETVIKNRKYFKCCTVAVAYVWAPKGPNTRIQDPGSRLQNSKARNRNPMWSEKQCGRSSKIGDDQRKVQSVSRIFQRISHSWPRNGEENFEILSNWLHRRYDRWSLVERYRQSSNCSLINVY